MNISNSSTTVVSNYVLSGSYVNGVSKEIKPKLFEFSSPTYPIGNFSLPYDAKLPNTSPSGNAISGAAKWIRTSDIIHSNRSGKLYYYHGADLYGTCHGFDLTPSEFRFFNGYNFYNAFYPAGYFSPPFGENMSIFKSATKGAENLFNGGCANLNVTEYNEQFGIVSKESTQNPNAPIVLAPIVSPREGCPGPMLTPTYFDEVGYKLIQGSAVSLGAGNFYNGNPIPTALDNHNIKLNNRYLVTGEGAERQISFVSNRPVVAYSTGSSRSLTNTTLCPASDMETHVAAGKGSNGMQMMEEADLLQQGIGDSVFFNQGTDTNFYYWHFTFRENAYSLPFYNNFETLDEGGRVGLSHTHGSQLFSPELSSEDSYWQNRQCPDIVDYLPWTFGASIYACPSNHFDVPYYAAIKKFGFYGTRFLNSCVSLDLQYPNNGAEHALEVQDPTPLDLGENEPEGIDRGAKSFNYDGLLKTAAAEENYSNMYALNKAFFFWANKSLVTGDILYRNLLQYNGFSGEFEEMTRPFDEIFSGGFSSFLSGEPQITTATGISSIVTYENSKHSNILFTNKLYTAFRREMDGVLFSSGSGFEMMTDLENKYSSYVSDGEGINETFYDTVVQGREKRLLTRYMENVVQGNAIDLYPLNHIPFATDQAKDYLTSTAWHRSASSLDNENLPQINRRYFEGAYGQASNISGLTKTLNALSFKTDTSFYPGFFNDIAFQKDLPTPSYVPVISGKIIDELGRNFSSNGWFALGYNEIGALDSNFSCFTPIFVQQPLPEVFCKIGQRPTFRAFAVDYHTIPDDKISQRYPEIYYWASKLKMINKEGRSLYPMKYKWFRVRKENYNGFIASGDFSKADFSGPSGDWGCLEGDCQTCTFINPKDSYPSGILNSDSYTFMQGVRDQVDDAYYYMCLASGRFGIRISERSELKLEKFLKFDISVKNGMNSVSNIKLKIEGEDRFGEAWSISIPATSKEAYCGYQQDETAIPESVVEQKRPPPNAGYGDVTAYRFIGPFGWIGATRTWKPDTVKDLRGLRGAWGRFLDYGTLVQFETPLTQVYADRIYGYKHLPTCENYSTPDGKVGVRVSCSVGDSQIIHWSLPQKAVVAIEETAGMMYDQLDNLGALYPPITQSTFTTTKTGELVIAEAGDDPVLGYFGIGHSQWGNNLGSIKRFGFESTLDDIVFIDKWGNEASPTKVKKLLPEIKEKYVKEDSLAGKNCGYTPFGLGRNMLYYLEAFDRFYLYCDEIKKKNVTNVTFLCPGLRQTNSAIQYFWMGQPSNTYVDRRPMYGPYAYQWRVRKHNRDRNGNGMSEGFYSMSWNSRFSMLYDAPAIFGLYVKRKTDLAYKNKVDAVIEARNGAFPNGLSNIADLRTMWFGVQGSEGGGRPYGGTSCSEEIGGPFCDYLNQAIGLANSPDFKSHECTEDQIKNGSCFDPCLSLRYGQGFFPGGKLQDMFGYGVHEKRNTRLVSTANINGDVVIENDENSIDDSSVKFRSPVNTPHAKVWKGLGQKIVGISPCKDGGSDHCNYLTPTLHLGQSSIMVGMSTSFNEATKYAANLFESYNIRGEQS